MNKTFSYYCECRDLRSDNNITKIHIQAEYTRIIDFMIDCDLTQVDEWYIKYDTLYVVLKNGDVKEVEGVLYECDYKNPEKVLIEDGSDFDDGDDYETITI